MDSHVTQNIIIKSAQIDELIIPTVNWLNSYDGIYTLYSCQGEFNVKGNHIGQPYVLFYARDYNQIEEVLGKMTNNGKYAVCEIYNGTLEGYLPRCEIMVRFHTLQHLLDFQETLK